MATFDPERNHKVLASHEVEYVLIGALAARLQGFPRMTAYADITPSQDSENWRNWQQVSAKLKLEFLQKILIKDFHLIAVQSRLKNRRCGILSHRQVGSILH